MNTIKASSLKAIAAYNSHQIIIDEDQLMRGLQDQLTELLVKASFQDIVNANELLTKAVGQAINITNFMSGALEEAIELEMTDQETELRMQIEKLIAQELDTKTALKLAVSLTLYYEYEIISTAKVEAHEADYAAAIQELNHD